MIKLNLYYTSHCHLCDLAESILASLSSEHDISWILIEIVDSDELLAKYSTRIPVIERLDNQTEIQWPFTTPELIQFLVI
ncbi:MAG: glutaredoxin family protein [Methylotenera sp.]|nr:glutaredoxin family protein [Methylotenera sp.]